MSLGPSASRKLVAPGLLLLAFSAGTAWAIASASANPYVYPWYGFLLYPAALVLMLIGGVHGDAPIWLQAAVASIVNGICWTAVIFWIVEGVRYARKGAKVKA